MEECRERNPESLLWGMFVLKVVRDGSDTREKMEDGVDGCRLRTRVVILIVRTRARRSSGTKVAASSKQIVVISTEVARVELSVANRTN